MVLVGVQPSFTQVPPTCLRSTRAVCMPASASARLSGVPPCPEPTTIASYCSVLTNASSVLSSDSRTFKRFHGSEKIAFARSCAANENPKAGFENLIPMTQARVVSVNVGKPREVLWKGNRVSTAIFKSPVEGRIEVKHLNLRGDQQADLTVHGGVDR